MREWTPTVRSLPLCHGGYRSEATAARLAGWSHASVGVYGEERVLVPGPEMSIGLFFGIRRGAYARLDHRR